MILAHRVSRTYLIPTQISTAQGVGSGTSYTVTPAVTPTDGNIIIITVGGSQTRTATLAGFTQVPSLSAESPTNLLMWKIASSEPASYTITWNLSLGGGWTFTELSNVDTSSPILLHSNGEVSAGTTFAMDTYDVTRPGFAISYISKSGGGGWTADNGFANVNPSGAHKAARKRYAGIDFGEVVNWSGPSEIVAGDLIVFKGRIV